MCTILGRDLHFIGPSMLQLEVETASQSDPTVTFREWLQGRRPPHLSTNFGVEPVAFQSWRNFKEAFAPELIGRASEETSEQLGRRVESCIDPFGGSGTTAISCQFLGIHPVTIEVNPYLADLTEAKLTTYDVNALIQSFQRVIAGAKQRVAAPYFPGAPTTFVEPGVDGKFVFHRVIAERLARLRQRIDGLRRPEHQRLMRVLLGAIALTVSNVTVSGKGRRYRRGWQHREVDPKVVNDAFENAFARAVYDIRRYQQRATTKYEVLRGDARKLIPTRPKFDLAVFSPPYPNSFDYTDVYNVELWVCGYLRNREDNQKLRRSTLRSHVQILTDAPASEVMSSTLQEVLRSLEHTRTPLWNRYIPRMVGSYFEDIGLILDRLKRCMRSRSRIYVVMGDSRYSGVRIPVSTIARELAVKRGFEISGEEPFRSMRSSPQQGGNPELLETLLVLNCP